MTFNPAYFKPQFHWSKDPPPPVLGQSAVEAITAGVAPRANPPAPPHRFSKLSGYQLISLINRATADSTCKIQCNLIIETAETHLTTAAFSSKEETHNTTTAPTRHMLPICRQKHHPRTARHTRPLTKPSSTHQPTYPPYATAVQQQTDASVRI